MLVEYACEDHVATLTLDITGRYLFAVNEIDEFQGLPTGSVESYRIEPSAGHLGLISRVPLSLSATMPRQPRSGRWLSARMLPPPASTRPLSALARKLLPTKQ